MNTRQNLRIGIVYPGNYETRQAATPENNRFADLFKALSDLGMEAEPVVYHPDLWQEVDQQLRQMDGVLVWINPIQDGHDRTVLDAMLRDIASAGIFVSAHPDIILKMGTKEVLYQTRHLGWGSDTYLYNTLEQLRQELPLRLATREARVLKQYRGHSGIGVWKVEWVDEGAKSINPSDNSVPYLEARVRVRHAERGNVDTVMSLAEFFDRCEPYFTSSGKVIDQAYQNRLPEGMIRCYLVHNQVVGFGHQAINALYPTPMESNPGEAPQPGPRLYHPPSVPEFQALKNSLEQEWLPALQQVLEIETDHLPIIWDADFLLGPKDATGADTYVLCEINVSSVAPYPESAVPFMVQAALNSAQRARNMRQPIA